MKVFTVFKAVTMNWLRSRSGLFFSIMFPILLLLVFGSIFGGFGGGSSTYGLYIQNQDVTVDGQATGVSAAFVEALNSTDTFTIRMIPADVNASEYARNSLGPMGGTLRIIVIDKGFQEDLINGTMKVRLGICYDTLNMTYSYFIQEIDSTQAGAIQQGMGEMQQFGTVLPDVNATMTIMLDPSDQSSQIVQNIIASVASSFNYKMIGASNVIVFQHETISSDRFRDVDFYIPGITAAFIMTNGIIGLTSTNTEFKRRGVIKRLSITPMTKMDWVVGCILSQTLLNVILSVVMIGVGWVVFSVHVIPDLPALLLIFLGSLMFSGIGMILAGVIKDIEAANAVGNAIAFPMMFLSGTFFAIAMMPSYLQTVAQFLPLTYFSEGLKAAMITQIPETIWFNTAVVGILAVVFIIVGAYVTRWKEN
jgi:ABC-2 type transport system permease protein